MSFKRAKAYARGAEILAAVGLVVSLCFAVYAAFFMNNGALP